MRKTACILAAVFIVTAVFAQKTELGISFNSGLFAFSGKSAEKHSFINYDNNTKRGYTNNPYGSKSGLCYGFSGNIKRVTKFKLLIGIDFGYEVLKSKISITGVSGYAGADGKTFLKYDFLNFYPFAGYRIQAGNIHFDVTGGFDIARCLKTREKGEAVATDGTKFVTSLDRSTIKSDLRPRLQVSANYKMFGLYAGYSHGWANYKKGYVGGINECYARLMRFGISYRVK